MKNVFLVLSLVFATAVAEEITLQDILNIKEQIRQDREEVARLQEQVRGSESDRDVDIAELKAVLTHQEEEIAQLNREIAKAKKSKPAPQKQPQMGCAPKPACPPPEPSCCEPVCCPKVYKELPPPCQRCPMMMRYYPAIEESQFAFRGEFLIWKTVVSPVDYALPKQTINALSTAAIGPYATVEYDWDPGFRLAMEYRFCPNFWQGEVQYTYLSNSGSSSVSGGNNPNPAAGEAFLTGSYLEQSGEALTSAKGDLDLSYQVLDFYLARRFLLADSIIIKMLIGVAGAWIDQDFAIRYNGFDNGPVSLIDLDWKYNAGGIKAGFANDWFLGNGFGISSQLVVGGFVGNFTQSNKGVTFDDTGVETIRENETYKDARFAFTTQFQIGLSWQRIFQYASLRLFAGYEMNPWFNINEMRQSSLNTNTNARQSHLYRGIVCPQGVTLRAQIGF
ncbi:MAG: hypothetical protein ChlgKO_13550 [Chlamydiales bacterium]